MNPLLFLECNSTDKKFYRHGSSKELLHSFLNFLEQNQDNITEISICLYLYNNDILHNKMKELASKGIKISIFSIPLEGYDNSNHQNIYDYETNTLWRKNATKYSLANDIYQDIQNFNNDNYSLYIFGHTFVRKSGMKHFSRGTLPYSLHIKSIYIKFKNNTTITGLTSSNFAVRDVSKDELLLLVEDTAESRKITETFYSNLLKNCVPQKAWIDPYPHFHYDMEPIICPNESTNYFTAPFLSDSPIYIEKKIEELISSAQKRIYICAEHLAAFNFDDTTGDKPSHTKGGIFKSIFEKCTQGIPVKCLSQTYVDANGDSHNQNAPSNTFYYKELTRKIDQLEHCNYFANKNVHAKFIIIDDTVIVSTGNFTPTEFIYGHVSIEKFHAQELKDVSYNGIFSEVSHYIIIENTTIANQLICFFEKTLQSKETYTHQKPSKYYLKNRFSDNDRVKALGAKFDNTRKKWYYTNPNDAHLFQQWH